MFGHDFNRGTKESRATPVDFEYAFVINHGEITTQKGFEAAGDGAAKMLVVRDNKSRALSANVVPTKGIDERGFAVDALADDVK